MKRIAWYYETKLPAENTPKCKALPLDPNDVPPDRITLFDFAPMLLLNLLASQTGYTLLESKTSMAISSVSDNQGDDLLLIARGEHGEVISRTSIANPMFRRVRGGSPSARLEETEFVVRLSDPDRIRSVEIEVRRGPNNGLRCAFDIPLSEGGKCKVLR